MSEKEGRKERGLQRRVIVEGSRVVVAGGAAGGSRGRAVLLGGLPGILPVLGWPGRACRACCTDRKGTGCSPWASGRTWTQQQVIGL